MRGRDSVGALRDDLDDTRAQLAEVQERLDFAERVLTAGRATDVGDERFLMLRPTSNDGSALSEQLIVVTNWFTELRERVGN
jgi:hypothetical protein